MEEEKICEMVAKADEKIAVQNGFNDEDDEQGVVGVIENLMHHNADEISHEADGFRCEICIQIPLKVVYTHFVCAFELTVIF